MPLVPVISDLNRHRQYPWRKLNNIHFEKCRQLSVLSRPGISSTLYRVPRTTMTYLARVQNKEIICTEISDPRRWFVRAEGLMKRLTGKKDIIPMKLRVCGEHGFRLGFTMLSVFALHRTK